MIDPKAIFPGIFKPTNRKEFVELKLKIGPFCVIYSCPGRESIIRSHTVIYEHTHIGERLQTGHGVLIREHSIIGNKVSIGSHSEIGHHVGIEDQVRIHSNCFIPEYSHIEKGCWLGPNVVLTNSKLPNQLDSKEKLQSPLICEGAIIGANTTILPGVTIHKNSVVGAGSVITKDVQEGTVVYGNPPVYHGLTKYLVAKYGKKEDSK